MQIKSGTDITLKRSDFVAVRDENGDMRQGPFYPKGDDSVLYIIPNDNKIYDGIYDNDRIYHQDGSWISINNIEGWLSSPRLDEKEREIIYIDVSKMTISQVEKVIDFVREKCKERNSLNA